MHTTAERSVRAGTWRRILFAIVMTLGLNVAIFTVLLWTQAPQMGTLLPTGRQAPAFALQDQDGRTHNALDYKGRPLVLTFFSELTPVTQQTLCALRDAMPLFDKASAKVFAISTLDSAKSKAFHDINHLNFPILNDPQARTAQIYGAFDANSHIRNASFAIDNTGTIMLTMPGAQIDAAHHGKQLLTMASCCFDPVATGNAVMTGHAVSDFALPRVDNGSVEHLLPASRFPATVVLFISAQCPCSQGYDARMKTLANTYTLRGARFLGVNSSADETAALADAHRRRVGLPFPVVKDDRNLLADRMNAKMTPEVYVLDAKGVVRYSGRIDDSRDATRVTRHDLQSALDAVLAGKQPLQSHMGALGCAITRVPVQQTSIRQTNVQ